MPATSDHQPLRTCVGCRRRQPAAELVRCAVGADGPALGSATPGRGAWLCSVECFRTARRGRRFDRAWRRPVADETLDRLGGLLMNAFESAPADMEN